MNTSKYFYVNNQKFNYTLEFQNNHVSNYWKHNAPLIDYCETLGITIPHYCYHKDLSISGNCRMCLVELKNSPKPMVSCAMSAKSCLNNSEIYTDSPLVKKARENVLEFLLLNHPLDCPICDQGGECDLQDQSLYFGISKKRFYNFKRIVTDKNIGPIVKTVMTRCIHCTRCVRFSAEIAGTEDLGMFGRGLDSEIGTYVNKTFQSELSGNVIDLCPVGALTSKPYPFLSRSWELKTTNSIDFSDGFGSNLQVSLKNNRVVKITPGYSFGSKNNPWISDKARFSFDGMFSPLRILKGFVSFGPNATAQNSSWKTLLTEITTTLYFQDHLNNHFLTNNSLFIVFSNNISLEVLNLLLLFSKKYSFIKLRKFEGKNQNFDFEKEFLTKPNEILKSDLLVSNLCFLIGLNTRYEGVNLNINLRQRHLKGNFKVLTLGSSKNLTFPTTDLGVTLKNLQQIVEGNHPLCQDLITSQNPTIVTSSSVLYRNDNSGFKELLSVFKNLLSKYHTGWNNINLLNGSLNEAGVSYLSPFKTISNKDLSTSSGLYFLNTQPNTLTFRKLTKLKLLNYNTSNSSWPTYCFEQNFGTTHSELQSSYKPYNYVNLPNGSFFESTGSFLNTEGSLKKTVKFVSTKSQTKEDWQIVRKIFSNTTKLSLLKHPENNLTLNFNTNNFSKFKDFINYQFTAINSLNNKASNTFNLNIKPNYLKLNSKFKRQKLKVFSTKLKIWLNDFYIGGNDSYSRYSATMVNCSRMLRAEKNNFSHLI